MVATVKSIKNAKEASAYFYMLEANQELKKDFQQNEITKELGLTKLTRNNLTKALSGKLTKGIELGKIEAGNKVHNSGQELILSAPKSVSIMALVAGKTEILEAHEKAVTSTLDYVQRNLIYYRVQKDGKKSVEKSDNAIIAKFTHQSSRSADGKVPDPQLHTHCLIANATKCQDGAYRSIVFDEVYKSKMNIGEIYRMELGKNIRELGYDIELYQENRRLNFEIKGVSKELITQFSQRRQQILEFAKEHGIEGAKGLAYAANATRGKKVDIPDLQKIWKGQCLDHQMPEKTEVKHISRSRDEIIKYTISSLSEREAVWHFRDLHRALTQKNRGDYSMLEIEKLIKDYVANGILIQLNNECYTTKENVAIEKEIISFMKLGQGTVMPMLDKPLETPHLNKGQKEAIKLILTSHDRVIGIQGVAGSGKTKMLYELKNMLNAERVMGLAPTKAATKVLQEQALINSKTISYFLNQKHNQSRDHSKNEHKRADFQLIIVDEASLCSNIQIKKLIEISLKQDCKLVLIGDSKQQGGIEAGKPFDLLCKNGMQIATMDKIQRQKNPDLLQSVYAAHKAVDNPFAKEHLYKAIKHLKNVINITSITNEDFAKACYAKFKEVKSQNPLIIVPSNDLKDKVNQLIRNEFIEGQSLSHTIIRKLNRTQSEIRDINDYAGDEVVKFNQDIKSLNIKKGDLFDIEKINHKTITLTDKSQRIEWNPRESKHFSLYEKKEILLSKGDRISIASSGEYTIQNITTDTVTLSDHLNKIQTFQKNDLKEIDYAYCSTTYSSQGRTANCVIGIAGTVKLTLIVHNFVMKIGDQAA